MLLRQKIQNDMSETRILIVGLGKTGLSCARFLAKKGFSVAVTDSRVSPPGLEALSEECPDIAVFAGGFDAGAFNVAEQIIVSPGVSLEEPLIADAIARGEEVIGDIELFAQYVDAPVVAITGSNGKSTVTTLLGEMVKTSGLTAKVGGNLGTPALDLLDGGARPDFYVLELSSFQLETTHSLKPVASVVLNVSADHMDRYRDIQHYSNVKQRINHGDGAVVVNIDDPLASSVDRENRKVIGFSLKAPRDGVYGLYEEAGQLWLAKGDRKLIDTDELRIRGRHNFSNALAALALAELIGLPLEKTLPCLSVFTGLPHRMQWVGTYDGVDWYNDSKATNVGAAVASIESLPGKLVLIAGGEGKDANFSQLKVAVQNKAKAVVLMGQDAKKIAQVLGDTVKIVYANNMEEAVSMAGGLAHEGESVLLAPACASFDMYSGFEERGLDFMDTVKRLHS